MNLWLVFLTGLTTGGLTCLAVQGGLLATAMTRRSPANDSTTTTAKKQTPAVVFSDDPRAVVYFLAAKLAAYTVLGFLLGAAGSALQISPQTQAIMQIIAALYMLATALNLLEVHPIFRYVVIQPPHAITRLVRKQSRAEGVFVPALLGALTILIPCGTTQAMMVLAISSGNALTGAAILFLFVLGTSPTFFVLGLAATRLQHRFRRIFTYSAATLIILLAFFSVDSALKVLNSPFVPSYAFSAGLEALGLPSPIRVAARDVDGWQEMTIHVHDTRYSPNRLSAQQDKPLRIRLITDETYSCTVVFTIPSLDVVEFLPNSGETVLELPPQDPQTLRFTCSMGMYSGTILIK